MTTSILISMFITPLVNAVKGDHIDAARLLLEHGADVNEYPYPYTHIYYNNASVDMMRLLLDYGADPYESDFTNNWRNNDYNPQYSEFHELCACGSVEKVALLLDWGMNVNKCVTIPDADEYKVPPLHYAAKEGEVDMIRLLMDRGADVSLIDEYYMKQYEEGIIKLLNDYKN